MSFLAEVLDLFIGVGFKYFERPSAFLLLIPAILLLVYFFRKDFVKLHISRTDESRKKRLGIYIFISRIFVMLLLVVSIASPYVETTKTVKGDPNVKILFDNSTSMEIFDLGFVSNLKSGLERRVPVETHYIAYDKDSRLAENILANMRKDDNILLITDGNNNGGVELGDIILQANSVNASVNAINLAAENFDASVAILGPDKTTTNVENEFTVKIGKTDERNVRAIIKVDGSVMFDRMTGEDEITFRSGFSNGYHEISAELVVFGDYFEGNNIFYKTVKVVPKPNVLLVSKNTELKELFGPLYNLNAVPEPTSGIEDYTAVVIDDIPAENLNELTDVFAEYIAEGNGLLVFGGKNSYEFGNYKESRFEQLLPVFVARAGRQRGDVNIVVLLDISLSTGESFGNYTKVDVEKALALEMLKSVSFAYNVGFVVFNTAAYSVAELKPLSQHPDLEGKVRNLKFFGGTDIANGLLGATAMLQNVGGSKNIILISDGRNNRGPESVFEAADYANSLGIRIYAVGVGFDTKVDIMQEIAARTNAVYFQPDTSQQIKLLFGDAEDVGDKKVFPLEILDENHFITHGLDLNARLFGFNQVVPKDSAKLLITTDVGDPVLTVSRFGLGRTASISSDVRSFGFEMLNTDNSRLLTRAANWVIGDPERKNKNFIDVPDGRIGEAIVVTVKSDVQPTSDKIYLYKIDDNLYTGSIYVNETGFSNLLGARFAVNNEIEYQNTGFNKEIENIVSATGGRMFSADDINGIAEFIKQRSRREILDKDSFSWIFLLGALGLYLIEVVIRRLVAYKII